MKMVLLCSVDRFCSGAVSHMLLYVLFRFKSVGYDGFHMTEAVSCGMSILLCCCDTTLNLSVLEFNQESIECNVDVLSRPCNSWLC